MKNTVLFQGQIAILHQDLNPCLPTLRSLVANTGSVVTDVLRDGNPATCIRLARMTENAAQIEIPLIFDIVKFDVKIVGHSLPCGPLSPMMVYGIGSCDEGVCLISACFPKVSGIVGDISSCNYRCSCPSVCHRVIVEVDVSTHGEIDHGLDMCDIRI